MAVADFGGALNGKKIEIVSADHQNKPDVADLDRPPMVRPGRGRHDRRPDDLERRAGGAGGGARQEQDHPDLGRRLVGPDRKACAPTSVHWTYDTVALANGTGSAVVKAGGDTWFFITADYAFGHALERDTADRRQGKRRQGVGPGAASAEHVGFFLLPAAGAGSGAKVIGLANAGGDTINSIKQAAEFGIVEGGQKLAGLLIFLTDVHSLGLKTAHGLQLTEASTGTRTTRRAPSRSVFGQDEARRRRWFRPAITARDDALARRPSRRPTRSTGCRYEADEDRTRSTTS